MSWWGHTARHQGPGSGPWTWGSPTALAGSWLLQQLLQSDQWSGNRVRKLRLWPEIVTSQEDTRLSLRDNRVSSQGSGGVSLSRPGQECFSERDKKFWEGTTKILGRPNYLELFKWRNFVKVKSDAKTVLRSKFYSALKEWKNKSLFSWKSHHSIL